MPGDAVQVQLWAVSAVHAPSAVLAEHASTALYVTGLAAVPEDELPPEEEEDEDDDDDDDDDDEEEEEELDPPD